MKWTLIQLSGFTRLWHSERLSDEDLQSLESAIMSDPAGAAVAKGTGGLRKIRFAPPSRGRGKSGSMRVGYVQLPEFRRIYLVSLFLKKDTGNFSAAECRAIKMTIERLAGELRQGRER